MATRRTRGVKDLAVPEETTAVIDAIRKRFGDKAIQSGTDIKQPFRIPTGIFLFDYATLGGIPHNRMTMFHGPKHSGKGGLETDVVLTPTGWRQYLDIVEGDYVIGSTGTAVQVTGVFPRGELQTYRVWFTDGTSCVVDGDHLWQVQTAKQAKSGRGHSQVISTRDLLSEEHAMPYGGYRYRIPMVGAVQYAAQASPLPLDPYLLGVFLANGSLTCGRPIFSTNDEGVVDTIRLRCNELVLAEHAGTPCRRWYTSTRFQHGRSNAITGALTLLGLAGLGSADKFVPARYLLSSPADRLALLQALLDCDGSVGSSDGTSHHKGGAKYHTRSWQLAKDVTELAQSLGGTATTSAQHRDAVDYTVHIVLPKHVPPFLGCARKVAVFSERGHRNPVRSIVAVTPEGTARVICISVDAPDQLYVTQHFVVTHNTTGALRCIVGAQNSMPNQQAVLIDVEGTYDATWGAKVGVDNDKLIVAPPDTGEQAVDMALALAHSKDVSLIVVDSLAALLPHKEQEASAEDSLVGQQSRLITSMLRKLSGAMISERKRDHFVSVLFINQQRSKIGGWSPTGEALSLPGGKAIGFFMSLEARWKNKEVLKATGGVDELAFNEHAFHIEKNKMNAGIRSGEFRMLRRPDEDLGLGEGAIDDAATMLVFAKRNGWLTGGGRGGQTLTFGEFEQKFGNTDEAVAFLYANPEVYTALRCSLIATHAQSMGMPPDFVDYLLGN